MMAFPYLRTVPPPPSVQELQSQQTFQSFDFTPVHSFGPASRPGFHGGRGNGRGNRGRGWSRKPPNAYNTITHNNVNSNNMQMQKTKKHACDTCDRSFGSDIELSEHLAQHQTCGNEGCTFSAHPKVVAKHIEVQHYTGLYARIKKDAEQWIEERKKKYPTKSTVDQKKQQLDERKARGERIPEPNARFGSRERGGGWQRRGKGRNHPYNSRRQSTPENSTAVAPEVPLINELIQSTPPILEQPPKVSDLDTKVESVIPNGNKLINLLGEYNSEDSDSEAAPEETPVSREVSGPPLLPPAPEIVKNVAKVVQKPIREQANARDQFKMRNRPPTLLQKLLEPEIRHERNVLLQCVHYVVQKNFFQ